MIDPELEDLVRTSVAQAFVESPDAIGAALAEFGWGELAETDEAFAYTVLFEAQGRLGADTDALDVVTAVAAGIDASTRVVWSLGPALGGDEGDDLPVRVTVDGVALRPVGDSGAQVLVQLGAGLCALEDVSIEEASLGGMAVDGQWVGVRVEGAPGSALAPWTDVARRARLALASEIVGVSERMLEVAVEQVSERRQFGKPIGVNQAVRHRLAEAYSELAGARSFVATAWEDGRPETAAWAKTAAGGAHSTVTKHAVQVCGAIGLHEEHPLPSLVRRGFALDALLGSAAAQRARIARDDLGGVLPEAIGSF